ncbi:NUDIX domain-containing protein [Altererythrobacter salegens]|uniref:8-oxo-dGTP diphosphatase n=1 Tax=Croceibacterium salegens TaxID=1737568 RepID=A0A6I4SVS3_9SPHN|nr:NUDIX domain-containing protein [Croceibacterium salegens]
MERNPTWLPVVAAAIRDEAGRLLLQLRPDGKHHAGLWEFPGGKVEIQEDQRLALAREIEEELALTLDPTAMEPLGTAEEARQGTSPGIALQLYACPVWTGVPKGLEGQEFGWFSPADAARLPLAPMDRRLLQELTG